ncbi:hypothetical protein DFH07DRAFT_771088 [Mycena maculata]|uniref:Uncharacterized protein n=1 Tax=Mycena maculata TaxID=230809 RepID=A0AAD7JCZ7_9AGAR|nr:hypothetical protein DFH07DRAFT_771088 [Mycena maculata]
MILNTPNCLKRHTWSTEAEDKLQQSTSPRSEPVLSLSAVDIATVRGLRDFWRNSSSIIGVGISRMPKKSLPSLKCSAMETIAVGDDIGDAVRIPCLEKSGVPKGLIRHFRHCPKQPEGQATTFGRRPWARNKMKIEVVSAGLQANCVHDALHPRQRTRSRMILQSCLAGNLRLQIFVYSVQFQSAISAAVVHMYRVYVSSHIEERSSRVVNMVVRDRDAGMYTSGCNPTFITFSFLHVSSPEDTSILSALPEWGLIFDIFIEKVNGGPVDKLKPQNVFINRFIYGWA